MLPLVLLLDMELQAGSTTWSSRREVRATAVATWHPTPPSFASVTATSSMNFHVRHPTPSRKVINNTFNSQGPHQPLGPITDALLGAVHTQPINVETNQSSLCKESKNPELSHRAHTTPAW